MYQPNRNKLVGGWWFVKAKTVGAFGIGGKGRQRLIDHKISVVEGNRIAQEKRLGRLGVK